ncbi:hypothetical protein RHGRI_033459 [Rhododendron griersonianum]|uniref:Type 1 phosphatases regulator n=1 Tax=Rhododendron griersonianum TaxID=479676 RepID=A0AAV6HWT8_9ERIC|nr:hypothetical protein RHGRI_033459 [Rhododendron griersonianum]
MARATSSATTTTTLTLNHRTPQALTLRLVRKNEKEKKKVTWKEGTVDNEFLQRKSSKKCCIFHKDKPFDEDDSDDDDDKDCNGCSEENHGPPASGRWV